MTHSPEPWSRGEENEAHGQIVDATECRVARVWNQYGIVIPGNANQQPGDANIERIVACVNACHGWTTEELSSRTFLKTGLVSDSGRPVAWPADNVRAPMDGEK